MYGKLDDPDQLPRLGSVELAADTFEHVRKLAVFLTLEVVAQAQVGASRCVPGGARVFVSAVAQLDTRSYEG